MQQTGILLNRSEVKSFESGFKTQEFFMDCKTFDQNTGQEYPNVLRFQVIGDKINLLNQYQSGQRITVSFNIKGKIYEKDGKKGQIQNLNVWKIDSAQTTTTQNFNQPQQSYQQTQSQNSFQVDEDDDLPF